MNKETKKRLLFYLATRLTWVFILLLGGSGRASVRHRRYYRQVMQARKGFIIICWHGKMLFPIYVHRNLGICAMVSEHADGEMIAQTIERLGYTTVRGSSTRGGVKAFVQLLVQVKKGVIGCVLPDGPRGPRHELKPGAVLLASRSQRPLLPMTFAAQKPIVMKSWDRFTLWKPLSKLCMLYGAPIEVPPNLDDSGLEHWQRIVQARMDTLEAEADAVFRN
jgi:lysophospholipid acyltransferase (LPLAT)-like uncharacterized protein